MDSSNERKERKQKRWEKKKELYIERIQRIREGKSHIVKRKVGGEGKKEGRNGEKKKYRQRKKKD